MADRTERQTLEHLIELCRDGEQGLRHAVSHVRDSSVKTVLMDLAWRRREFAMELQPHARRLGGAANDEGTAVGALHRRWISLTDVITGHDDMAIVREAERGERAALAAYEEALSGMLPPTVRDLVEHQYAQLLDAHNRVETLLPH